MAMAQDEQTTNEESKGSIIPAVGGAAVGGTAGAVWGYRSSQKKAAAGLSIENAAHGTPLGLVKEHIAAAEKRHIPDTGLAEEWNRLTQGNMEKPSRPSPAVGAKWSEQVKLQQHYRGELGVYSRQQAYDEIEKRLQEYTGKHGEHAPVVMDVRQQLSEAEAALHNAAAEHLVTSRKLKPLGKDILKDMEGITSKLPRGGAGKTIVGATVLATVGGLAAQAFLGRAERPHPSRAARVRAEQAAVQQEQGQGL